MGVTGTGIVKPSVGCVLQPAGFTGLSSGKLLAMKKNLALVTGVLLLCVALLEKSFLWWYPRVFPANVVLTSMDEGLQPLLQNSKRGVFPEHYIALFGDSYAQGMGDWAKQAMQQPMARYHTAHLLHEATGRDVVTFGSAGAGSVRGMVTEPVSQLAYLRQYISSRIPAPELALVYFYEGNDLYDNAGYFRYSFPRLFDAKLARDPGTYRRYLQQFALERDETWLQAARNDPLRHWPFLAWTERTLRQLLKLPAREEPQEADIDASLDPPWIFGAAAYREPGTINRALIGGQDTQLPDFLQGPALNLDQQEWDDAWFAFEQALAFSREQFPQTQFVLVYIPSVLGTYAISSAEVTVQAYDRRDRRFTSQAAVARAAQMREKMASVAAAAGLPLIDTTAAMQQAGREQALHGPGDWNHPNRRGYEVLAAAIIAGLP